jgi:hypothetical protein
VSKAIAGSVLILTIVLVLPGCGTKAPPAPPAPAATPAAPSHPLPAAAYAAVDLSGIKKAEGGKTVAEVYADKDQLAGKTVIVRGKVVKTNANIMGKNWLHVRDGTGADKTNDLTVTTSGPLPSAGETVVVTGTVSLHRDLGLGYQYDVLIEDAKVATQ